MPPVVPSAKRIRSFRDATSFERWLSSNHTREPELWLKIHKKDSGLATVTYAEAVDVALCWGWIDGLRKAFDERSFLQRFTPRKPKSVWSQVNREHVARLVQAGRMTEHGLAHVEAARADGRWDAAYAPQSRMTIPEPLFAAIAADPAAQATFDRLDRASRFALAYRLGSLKTEAARARRIDELVRKLALGETFRGPFTPPEAKTPPAKTPASRRRG